MKPDSPLLVLSVLLVILAGCLNDPPRQSQAAPSTGQSAQAAQFVASSTKTAYSDFFDQWESFQRAALLENAKSLEQSYLNRKKNPDIDPRTGKQRPTTPMSALMTPIFKMQMSPAINTFEPHVNNPNSAAIGDLSLDRAKMRVRVEDEKLQAIWIFFAPRMQGLSGPVSRFTDAVGGARTYQAISADIKSAVRSSFREGGARESGTSGAWTFEVRPLDFFAPTCITCHADKKVGDLAGVMVYMAAPRQQGQ